MTSSPGVNPRLLENETSWFRFIEDLDRPRRLFHRVTSIGAFDNASGQTIMSDLRCHALWTHLVYWYFSARFSSLSTPASLGFQGVPGWMHPAVHFSAALTMSL